MPPPGSKISLVGLNFIEEGANPLVVGTLQDALHQETRTRSNFGNAHEVGYSVDIFTGKVGGLIYGGKNHPTLQRPAFYTLTPIEEVDLVRKREKFPQFSGVKQALQQIWSHRPKI